MLNRKQTSEPNEDSTREQVGPKVRHKSKFAIKIITRGAVIRLIVLVVFLAIFCLWGYLTMIKMPEKSYAGSLPLLTDAQLSLRNELVHDVKKLASQIGERNIWQYYNLTAAADFIEKSLAEAGYKIHRQNYQVEGKTCCNIEAEIVGTKHPALVKR